MVKVKNHPDLKFDIRSGAIINTNKEEMTAAKERKAARIREAERFDQLENDVNDIKKLLSELIGKLQ